jgi:hypothetical protein
MKCEVSRKPKLGLLSIFPDLRVGKPYRVPEAESVYEPALSRDQANFIVGSATACP